MRAVHHLRPHGRSIEARAVVSAVLAAVLTLGIAIVPTTSYADDQSQGQTLVQQVRINSDGPQSADATIWNGDAGGPTALGDADPAPSSDGTTVQPEDTTSTVTRRQEEDPTTASYPTATDTKTDEDPALTQGSSSADVPPASPDVVIKDSLDKDEASVTKIAVNQIVDGSAPFDKDDNRGDDSSDSNLRVRSFDRITYLLEVTATSDDAMTYYKNGRIGYKITLPVDKYKAVFNYGVMGWVDQTDGYAPTVVDNPDGTQTMTVYKPLNPTDESPTVIPGVYEVPIIIDVKAMHEGESLQPEFEAWTAPNDVSHRSMKIKPDPIVITSIPKYDIDLRGDGYQTSGAPTTWDFGKTDPRDKPVTSSDGMNKELGKQRGILSYIRFGINMRWKDTGKHLRGLEIPRPGEPLKIRLDVSNTVTQGKDTELEPDARLQPYFWAANSHYGYMQGMRSRETSPTWRAQEWSSSYPYFYNEGGSSRVYNGGSLTIDQTRMKDKTVLDITIKDWEIDPNKFPRGPGNAGQCNCLYSTVDCTIRVAQFSQGAIYMFSPTRLDGKDLGVYYNSDVTLKQHVETAGMNILSTTGDLVTAQEDPTDAHGNPTNNVYNGGFQLYPQGKGGMQTWYACSRDKTTYQSWSTECSGWRGATFNGTDKAEIGSMVRLHMQINIATSNSWDLAGVFSINLAKIDDKLLEVPEDLRLSDPENTNDSVNQRSGGWWNNTKRGWIKPIIRYATKPDGKGWTSDEEQSNAQIEDLRYWDDYNEAKSHGVIVGFIVLSKEAGINISTTFMPLRAMVKVKDDAANIGKTAQFTQVAETWTREDLIKAGVVPEGIGMEDPKSTWDGWTKTVDPMELRAKVKPTYHIDSKNHYRKSTYDSAGTYIPGTEGYVYGDTLLVVGESTKIGLTTTQHKPNDPGSEGKTIYDLDNGQRYVDWILKASSESLNKDRRTDHKITVTVPKGLSYVTGSSKINGSYKENTPDPGTVTGGEDIKPVVTVNKDGTTTLVYDVPDVKTDGVMYPIHFTTYIGDPTDPDNDAKNGQQYIMDAKIQSTYDIVPGSISNLKRAQFTMQVSRTRANQLATRALSLINDTNRPLSFKNMISNSSSSGKTNVWAVNILPWNGVNGSNYRGTHSLTSIDLTTAGVALDGNVTAYVTTDPRYRTVADPSGGTDPAGKITGDEISSGWTQVPIKPDGTVDLSSIKGDATAFAIHLNRLDSHGRLDAVWEITPEGNSSSDVYGNRWSDLSNTVNALTSIADREVNGVVWWDRNEDGSRQPDEERLPGVKVKLVDALGRVITKTDGSKAETMTDENGRWSISKIPAGANYKVRFTPDDDHDWVLNTVTLKRAADVPVDKNSDADAVDTLGRMNSAEISLAAFPTVDKMTSSRYVDPYEDVGLKYANFVQRAAPNTGGRDLIILGAATTVFIILAVVAAIFVKRYDKRHETADPQDHREDSSAK